MVNFTIVEIIIKFGFNDVYLSLRVFVREKSVQYDFLN